MKVDLLGCGPVPGAGEPSPRPGCQCVSCLGTSLIPRRPAAALVSGRLLLDAVNAPPPTRPSPTPRAMATRAGSELDVPMPGDRYDVAGLMVEAHPAGDVDGSPTQDTVVLVVMDEAGRRLLWAPATGPLPTVTLDALAGRHLDAVAVDALGPRTHDPADSSGRASSSTNGTDPLLAVGHQIARLRSVGAVDHRTDLVAVGLGHGLPPLASLSTALAPWGMGIVPDGTVLDLSTPRLPRPTLPRRTLVLGPAGSGKSVHAEHLLAAEPSVQYLATGPALDAGDAEWTAKVEAHRARRPAWWRTVETTDLPRALTGSTGAVLIDSLSTWLTSVLDSCGAWEDAEGWRDRMANEVDAVVRAVRKTTATVVAVSDEVGWSVVPESPSGRLFREALGSLNQRLAAESERVLLVVAGRVVDLSRGFS